MAVNLQLARARKEAVTADALIAVRTFLTLPEVSPATLRIRVIKSKLTAKAQTTIPRSVREALHLQVGDEIAYEIRDDRVVLSKASSAVAEDPFATFSEWDGAADRDAYAGL